MTGRHARPAAVPMRWVVTAAPADPRHATPEGWTVLYHAAHATREDVVGVTVIDQPERGRRAEYDVRYGDSDVWLHVSRTSGHAVSLTASIIGLAPQITAPFVVRRRYIDRPPIPVLYVPQVRAIIGGEPAVIHTRDTPDSRDAWETEEMTPWPHADTDTDTDG